MPSAQQPKSISHVVDETTTFRVGMLSVRTSIKCSCNRLGDLTLAGLLLPCCAGLTENTDRWSEAVQTIDFSHSSRKAWSILNSLTGRSRRSPRHCAVSANAIASVLVNNG